MKKVLFFLTIIFLVMAFAENDIVVTDDVIVLKPEYDREVIVNDKASQDSIIINDDRIVVNFEDEEMNFNN